MTVARSTVRRRFPAGLPLTLSLLAASCANPRTSAVAKAPVPQPGPAPVEPPPVTVEAFEQACSRCHGPRGSFFDVPFKHKGADLREVTVEMMKGPGQLQPTEAEIDDMMAFLRWIEAKRK